MDILSFLPHLAGLRIGAMTVSRGQIEITAHTTAQRARCPEGGAASGKVHSRTWRYIADPPWAERQVTLRLRVRRLFRLRAAGTRRAFTEQTPQLVALYGRRSVPLTAALEAAAWPVAPARARA
jgi:transposase